MSLIVTVPGLRGHVEDHWQTRLAADMPNVVPVAPLGRENPSLAERVAALDEVVASTTEPIILVAHSAGVLTVVHWAARHPDRRVLAALLATPPDLASPLPPEYPSWETLHDNGWLPIPRVPLPFLSLVAGSSNDPLGDPGRVRALAKAWGSHFHDLGEVGHLNPASGYGPWPEAEVLINELITLETLR
jgi:predicted alpha/beta hydrolase family esterase